MQYYNNQKDGLSLARFGLGCMRMSGSNNPDDRKEGIATIHAALDAGISFLNTGDFYGCGHNEMLVGEAIKGYDRDKVFISVKFGGLSAPNGIPYGIDSRPLAIKNYLTYSLKRLDVDYIDLYQPCRIDPEIPVEETLGPLAEMVKAGYVKYIGLSEVDAVTLRRAASVHPISLVELGYSVAKRNIEKEVLPTARELGIGVVAFGVLSHGMLSKERVVDMKNRFPQFAGVNTDKNISLIGALNKIAEEKQITLPQLLIAWVFAQGNDIIPLIGARTVSQLQESLKALDVTLSDGEIKLIENSIPDDIAADKGITMKLKNGLMVR